MTGCEVEQWLLWAVAAAPWVCAALFAATFALGRRVDRHLRANMQLLDAIDARLDAARRNAGQP